MIDLAFSILWALPIIVPCAWVGFKVWERGQEKRNELMSLAGIWFVFCGPFVVVLLYVAAFK